MKGKDNMGLENKETNSVQISEKAEKRYIVNIVSAMLNTNIELMTYHKRIAKDKKMKKLCQKSIDETKQGIIKLNKINHIEILRSIYKTTMLGKESIFVVCGSLCNFKEIDNWDNTESGFQDFLKLENQGNQDELDEYNEKIKQQEILEQAQKDGKTIEYVFDKESGKTKPVIVDDNNLN